MVYWLNWLHCSTFLWSVFCLPTCLEGWKNGFWLTSQLFFVFVIFVVVVVVCIVTWDRVIGATFFNPRNILSVCSFCFSVSDNDFYDVLVSFTVVARCFGSVGFCICGIVAHSDSL